MWNLNYDTKELIYETEVDSQTQRADLKLPGGGGGGGMGWEFEISRQTIIPRVDKQQGPIAYYGELIQYPAINHMKKNMCVYIYEYMYMYIYSYMYDSLCSIAEINTIL